jgi:CheY-like chemotaxis protein
VALGCHPARLWSEPFTAIWLRARQHSCHLSVMSISPSPVGLRIALVDDDRYQADGYLKAMFVDGHMPTYFPSPASCLTALRKRKQFDIFVVDVMMGLRGAFSAEETDGGKTAGAALAKGIREHNKHSPIVLFTNSTEPLFLAEVSKLVSDVECIGVVKKADFPPLALSRLLDRANKKGLESALRQNLLHRLWDRLILEPNFHGIGFSLKKAVN